MNIRISFTVSIGMHILFLCYIAFFNERELDFSVTRGVSSIAVNMAKEPLKKQKSNLLKNHEILVTITSDHLAFFKSRDNRQNISKKKSVNVKQLQGALNKKASLLSKNQGPVYPMREKRFRHEGTVILRIEILPDGLAGRISIIKSSGYSMLDNSAINAVKQWKFFNKNEMTIGSTFSITRSFIFKMED